MIIGSQLPTLAIDTYNKLSYNNSKFEYLQKEIVKLNVLIFFFWSVTQYIQVLFLLKIFNDPPKQNSQSCHWRENWLGPRVFSPSPPKYNLSKMARKLGENLGLPFWTNLSLCSVLAFVFWPLFLFSFFSSKLSPVQPLMASSSSFSSLPFCVHLLLFCLFRGFFFILLFSLICFGFFYLFFFFT